MTIRTDADIQRLREDGALTSAEKTLIENCRAGDPTVLGEDVPDGPSDARTIRADLLRYLIIGGCYAWLRAVAVWIQAVKMSEGVI